MPPAVSPAAQRDSNRPGKPLPPLFGVGYDVVDHSNRFTTRLVPLGIFEKLDMSRFTNLDNLDPELWSRLDLFE